ncbi:DUF4135 domain-containing protein [Parachitinimonas caeni]|uniref:DUF4135 domain-containing protein n=1 Tax=Parachitinimonas caeni TaxID=3031301 RepID=A0ABT7DXD0_9NEIS|nr:DUF4135 domain-containing protein [Parachitinimonas caeni]MDK2124723.1 DUF4135 domain-containing protein [Parachitinimonas caeni]
MTIQLNTFVNTAQAHENAPRLTKSGDDAISHNSGTFFKRNATLQAENGTIRSEFGSAIQREFTAPIADQVFPSRADLHPDHSRPLSSASVKQVTKEAITEGVAQARTQAMADANDAPIGDRGNWKLSVREARALNDRPNVLGMTGQNRTEMANGIVGAYRASGEMAIDQTATHLTSSLVAADVAKVQLVNDTITQLRQDNRFPDGDRARVYESFLKDALLNVVDSVSAADQRDGCPLLARVGAQLAKQMDGVVAGALLNKAGQSQQEVVNTIQQDPKAFFSANLNTFHLLQNNVVGFARNINEVLGRVQTDRNDIAATFLGNADNAAITDIHITGSDPHHGGQKVLILTFAHGENGEDASKVVYKPRDCRVDAKLVGTPNVGGNGQSVVGLLNEQLGEEHALPTYSYLLKSEDDHHYGYSQFLDHQAADYQLNEQGEVDRYYSDMGKLGAVAHLFGATDLHQGNVIVSGGRPYLTDLEISFSKSLGPRNDGSLPSIGATGFDRALTSRTENDYIVPYGLDENGRITPRGNVETNSTANFVELNGHPVAWNAQSKASFATGYNQVLDNFANADNNQALQDLTAEFNDMHVRYHPVATMAQLQKLENSKLNSDRTPDNAVNSQFLQGDKDALFDVNGMEGVFGATMKSDFMIGDVAYYSRALGDGETVYHHDRDGAHEVNQGDQHPYGYDGLAVATAKIQSLTTEDGLADMRQLGTDFTR